MGVDFDKSFIPALSRLGHLVGWQPRLSPRSGNHYLFLAVFFGGFTQLAEVVLFGDSFSASAAVVGGLFFATAMTAYELWRRKNGAAG